MTISKNFAALGIFLISCGNISHSTCWFHVRFDVQTFFWPNICIFLWFEVTKKMENPNLWSEDFLRLERLTTFFERFLKDYTNPPEQCFPKDFIFFKDIFQWIQNFWRFFNVFCSRQKCVFFNFVTEAYILQTLVFKDFTPNT